MAFRDLRYYCSEAFKSIWYNIPMAVTSVITVMGCLLLFGFFLVLGLNINHITRQVEAQCEIQAFMPMSANADEEQAAFNAVKAIPGIGEVIFETRDEAYANYKEMLGEKAVVLNDLNPADFLPASCRITPADVTTIPALIEQIEKIQGIEEVVTPTDTIDSIISTTSVVRKGCIICTILLAIIAVFIITNTIKLDINARQKEIHIMKYVGATDWFIRWPFIIEGIFVGLIGSIISITLLSFAISFVVQAATANFSAFKLLSFGATMPWIVGVLLVLGTFIGALGSLIAVRKHLQV